MQMLNEMALNPEVEKYLKGITDKIKDNPPEDNNNGHNNLMQDLTDLLKDAVDYEFHDFKNTKYAAPKVQLNSYLEKLQQNVINGRYDN